MLRFHATHGRRARCKSALPQSLRWYVLLAAIAPVHVALAVHQPASPPVLESTPESSAQVFLAQNPSSVAHQLMSRERKSRLMRREPKSRFARRQEAQPVDNHLPYTASLDPQSKLSRGTGSTMTPSGLSAQSTRHEVVMQQAGRLLKCVEGGFNKSLSGKVPDCEQFGSDAQLKLAAVLERHTVSQSQGVAVWPYSWPGGWLAGWTKPQSNNGIAVVSVCHGQSYAEICKVARRNMEAYSKRHGYDLLFHDQPLSGLGKHRAGAWEKILAIQEAFTKASITHVWWQDADSLFMNMSQPLDVLAPRSGADLTMSGDQNCFLNSGHLMFRNSQWSSQLLHDAWVLDPPPEPDAWFEQSAFIYLLSGKKAMCRQESTNCCRSTDLDHHVDVHPQKSMNSYVVNYKAGDFIIHFAGSGSKASLMNQYAKQAEFVSFTGNQEWLADFHAAIVEGVASLIGKIS